MTLPRDSELRLSIVIVLAILGLAVLFWVFASSAEAAAFEHVTGKQVSTWDAMFLDLRVMEATK